jgi:hypothetical protein
MQLKLHRWAREDPAPCFGELYNLVYEPAFDHVALMDRLRARVSDKRLLALVEVGTGGQAPFRAGA